MDINSLLDQLEKEVNIAKTVAPNDTMQKLIKENEFLRAKIQELTDSLEELQYENKQQQIENKKVVDRLSTIIDTLKGDSREFDCDFATEEKKAVNSKSKIRTDYISENKRKQQLIKILRDNSGIVM